eukprot:tig00001278_g7980.t1
MAYVSSISVRTAAGVAVPATHASTICTSPAREHRLTTRQTGCPGCSCAGICRCISCGGVSFRGLPTSRFVGSAVSDRSAVFGNAVAPAAFRQAASDSTFQVLAAMPPRGPPVAEKDKTRINREIRAKEVRLIDEEGEMVGVVSLADALARAEQAGLDLVEISNQEPIVAKIIDYGKYKYQMQKKMGKQKATKEVKEIKLRPGIDVNDYNVKMRQATRFLEDGHKIKFTLRFQGREMALQQVGVQVLERVQNDLAEKMTIESKPNLMGRQMIMVVAPKAAAPAPAE